MDIAARACWREMTYGQYVFVDGTLQFLASIRNNIVAVVSAPLSRGASATTSFASSTLDPCFQFVLSALLFDCRCGGDARRLVGQLVSGIWLAAGVCGGACFERLWKLSVRCAHRRVAFGAADFLHGSGQCVVSLDELANMFVFLY